MKEEIRYLSTNGTDTIYGSIWHSVGRAPIGVVQIVHGMCEYIDRYEDLANFLVSEGFVVCGEDHLGHGRTAGIEGLGYFGPCGGWGYMVEDLYKLTELMKRRYPTLPYFLLGHSMGSLLARVYITRYGELIDGVLLSGTSGPSPTLRMGLMYAKNQIRRHGELYRSEKLNDLVFGTYNNMIKPPRTEKDWLTRDEAVVDRYLDDPYCNFIFTNNGFLDLFRLSRAVSAPDWAIQIPKHLPVFLYAGEMDPVGDYGKGVTSVYKRIRGAGVRDTTMKLYEGARHEPHNELNKEEVYLDIADWIKAHIF